MRIWTIAAVLFALGAGQASADTNAKPYNWTGVYVGAQAGYAIGESLYTNTDFPGEYVEYDPDGSFGGVYAGYNYQLPSNVVLGVEADLNLTPIEGSNVYWWIGIWPYETASAEIKYTAAVRARIGYAMGRYMPYIAAGVAIAKYDFDFITPAGHVYYQESETLTGWNIGFGSEYAATDNLLIRAEYRYSDFGSAGFSQPDFFSIEDAHINLATHDFRIGVAFKF